MLITFIVLPFESRRIYSYTHVNIYPFHIRIVVDSASFSVKFEHVGNLSRQMRNVTYGPEYSLSGTSFEEENLSTLSVNLDGAVDQCSTTGGRNKFDVDGMHSIEYACTVRESSRGSHFTTDALKGMCDAVENTPTPLQELDAAEATTYGSANNRKMAAPSSRASNDASLSSASLSASTYSAMSKRLGSAGTTWWRDARTSESDNDPISVCTSSREYRYGHESSSSSTGDGSASWIIRKAVPYFSSRFDRANIFTSSIRLEGAVDECNSTSGTSKSHADGTKSIELSSYAARESSCATRNLTDAPPPKNDDAYSPNKDDTLAMAAFRSRLRALVESDEKDHCIDDDEETFTTLCRADGDPAVEDHDEKDLAFAAVEAASSKTSAVADSTLSQGPGK